MRIGIDARFYGTFGKGLGRYTEKLITNLEKIDHHNQYFVLLRKENWADYTPRNKNFKKVLADFRWYTVAEQLLFPLKLWTLRLDLVHFTHFNVPVLYRRPFVVTIHDLILAKYPTQRASALTPLLYKLKHRGYKFVIKSAVQRAKKVIAVSEFTKKEVTEHFCVNPQKIKVTYEAVDPTRDLAAKQGDVLRRYRVRKPYFLYVGNVYPHKNIEGLLKAFKKFLHRNGDYHLVLVGKEDYFFKRVKKLVRLMDLEQKVIFTGFVTDTDLPYLYTNAKFYAFPSFCEGFGLPALEACSYGIPVIASNSSCLPEVLADAALFFNPENIDEIVHAMHTVVTDDTVTKKLIAAGYRRSQFFSWEKMAEITLDLYNEV